MLKRLFKLNVSKSLLIVTIVSLPLILFTFNKGPLDFQAAKLFGRLASSYFLLAFLLYLLLYSISHLPKSILRGRLVVFTRVYIRFHIAISIIGTILIVLHVTIMASVMPITPKTITGLLALIALFSVLFTGYLRKRKSSGKRRKFHRYMAFLFIAFVIMHVIV
jgi:membrane-anchored protein YejM (alkaline phosphatase superfamily)